MKKTFKTSLYIITALLVCGLVFFQLKRNKAETAKITALASMTGNFYPVKATTIEEQEINNTIETNGFLRSETDLDVLSETQGIIQKIYKEKGDYVRKGDIIAKVDDELFAAQLSAAKAAYEQLKKEVDRFTTLHEQHAVTSQKLEEIKLNYQSAEAQYISAKRQFEDTRVKAPIDGFIENDFIEEGQYLNRNQKVCNIIDAQKLKLDIAVSEQNYRYISLGQQTTITSPVYPNVKFEGKISYIGKKAGYGNTFDADVQIVNDDNHQLKAGMFVTASIAQTKEIPGIYIPRNAINGSLKDASVYVIENEIAKSREVTTGQIVNDQVEIVAGLKAGDQIVTEGNYSIFDGAKIRITQ
ncbi:efflux RND transporter periplasmic adaptor subunit [Mangrovibacterium diazotrophicum]|uniref:RND family efflux transporter MFP subunit n=1 Tax=Mangrovibacterium diazotrophicum TaxID=1261403 RepID=A0A419W5A8_9BACT|nr:efflux RND transporter periplasmic adaptor subunit [Mangrovibacterium diazotrophicum]RKD90634.1 RND family efflux transporter MFP subunit [Mangrovibacterium diazotrophicum]